MLIEGVFFTILISGRHFVKGRKTILVISVEGHSRNIPVKLF